MKHSPALSLCGSLLTLLVAGCPQNKIVDEGDPGARARDEVLVRLTERSGRIVDYRIGGQRCFAACDSASPSLQHFIMELRTPGLFRIELPDEKKTITFDGSTLVETLAGAEQQRVAIDPKGSNSALPYRVSGQFITEGWRAPLLASTKKVPAQIKKDALGPIVILQRPLQDAQLDRVEYWFRLPKADFIKTRFVTKDGHDLKRVEVTQEHHDLRSGYAFPKRWQVVNAQGKITSWVQLNQIAINTGIAKSRFKQ